jgi:hypothetical protein
MIKVYSKTDNIQNLKRVNNVINNLSFDNGKKIMGKGWNITSNTFEDIKSQLDNIKTNYEIKDNIFYIL